MSFCCQGVAGFFCVLIERGFHMPKYLMQVSFNKAGVVEQDQALREAFGRKRLPLIVPKEETGVENQAA